MIEELVRDLTKVGSISKSEAKARILEYVDQALQQRTESIIKEFTSGERCTRCGDKMEATGLADWCGKCFEEA